MNSKHYIYTTSLGHLANDTAQGSLPALLPLFINAYGLNYQEAAGLIFANTALASILQPFFGYLADKKSMPWLIPLGIAMSGSSIAAMGFTGSYWGLFILALLAGMGSALFHPEGARLIHRYSGEQKGKYMGTFSVGGNGGFAVGPLLAGTAYLWGSHSLILFAIINLTVAGFIFYLLNKEHIHPKVATSAKDSTSAILPDEKEASNDWKSFRRLSVIILTRSLNFAVLNTFIPIYWITVLHQPTTSANFALTIFFSIGVIITFLGGVLADRVGFVKVIRYSYILLVPVMLLFTNSSTYWLSLFLLVPLGFGLFAQYSPIVVLGQKYLAKSVGFSAGITLGVGITLGGIFAPVVGWLADQYGVQQALQVLNIVTIVGLLASFFLREKGSN